jgi:uncharacterized protein YjiS (DUF1127 family)
MLNRIIAAYKNMRNKMDYNKKVRETYKQLSALTNHELNDIGISRGEIYDVAHNSYKRPAKVLANENVTVNENLRGFV